MKTRLWSGHKVSWLLIWLACAVLFEPTCAHADYELNSGDVVEISVFGIQDFKRRTTINIDGDISLPLLGAVRASGLTLAGLRSKLKHSLIANNIIRDPDITVELVELRPFFINGDVTSPGAHPYQPDLTVRRAVAIAGGYDLVRLKVDNPLLAAADTRSQYEGLWAEFVRRQARVISLKAELDGRPTLDLASLQDAPIARRVISEITELEMDHFSARKANYEKEREHLQRALAYAQGAVASLFQGQQQEAIGLQMQAQHLEKTTLLSSKGLAPTMRVLDEQGAAALQRSHQLDTSSRVAEAQLRTEEASRNLGKLDDDRRMLLVRELQDEIVQLEQARAQLQGVGEKLLYLGAIKSLLSRGGHNPPDVSIYRIVDGKPTWIAADETSEVHPGDVVDIVFSQKQLMLNGAP